MNPEQPLDEFTRSLSIFPLPQTIFFPGTILPLHVFEPRYKQLVEASLLGERLMGIALLQPGWQTDDETSPKVFEIATMGRIAASEQLAEGRFNIALLGLARVRILSWVQELPFRIAQIEILEDVPDREEGYSRDREELIELFHQLPQEIIHHHFPGQERSPESLALGPLADYLTSLVDFDPYEKQKILETLDWKIRTQRLKVVLDEILQCHKMFKL